MGFSHSITQENSYVTCCVRDSITYSLLRLRRARRSARMGSFALKEFWVISSRASQFCCSIVPMFVCVPSRGAACHCCSRFLKECSSSQSMCSLTKIPGIRTGWYFLKNYISSIDSRWYILLNILHRCNLYKFQNIYLFVKDWAVDTETQVEGFNKRMLMLDFKWYHCLVEFSTVNFLYMYCTALK